MATPPGLSDDAIGFLAWLHDWSTWLLAGIGAALSGAAFVRKGDLGRLETLAERISVLERARAEADVKIAALMTLPAQVEQLSGRLDAGFLGLHERFDRVADRFRG